MRNQRRSPNVGLKYTLAKAYRREYDTAMMCCLHEVSRTNSTPGYGTRSPIEREKIGVWSV